MPHNAGKTQALSHKKRHKKACSMTKENKQRGNIFRNFAPHSFFLFFIYKY